MENKEENLTEALFGCGYLTGLEHDKSRFDWDGKGPRPLAYSVWYPTKRGQSGRRTPSKITSFFNLGDVHVGAPLSIHKSCPIVLLSHGTGGTAESIGWLARYLACRGFFVLAVNHHGNTGIESYRPEGFLCWWERATDLTQILTVLSNDVRFGPYIDLDQVFAAGFSLGSYAALALAGARTSMDIFNAWIKSNDMNLDGPKEFPNVSQAVPSLLKTSVAFKNSWERQSQDFQDERIKGLACIAAPVPVRSFTDESVSEISIPVTIIAADADAEAPRQHCSDWLVQQNPGFSYYQIPGECGHYTFLEFPANMNLWGKDYIFRDHPSVNRAEIHEHTAQIIIEAFTQ